MITRKIRLEDQILTYWRSTPFTKLTPIEMCPAIVLIQLIYTLTYPKLSSKEISLKEISAKEISSKEISLKEISLKEIFSIEISAKEILNGI